jgi:hypothetical protein
MRLLHDIIKLKTTYCILVVFTMGQYIYVLMTK